MRNFELPGRSQIHSLNAMAATSHPLATVTAIKILQEGGNAIDAAVAAVAVQSVVEPQSTGIGGDCFILFSPGGGEDVIAYNGSGSAPAAASLEWYVERGISKIEQPTPHAVTVPGAIDAWARIVSDYGTKSLGDLLQAAITFARDGYPISSRIAYDFANNIDLLGKDPTAERIFMTNGEAPSEGAVQHQPELADTLKRIAKHGRDGFYTGPVAEDIVSHLKRLGGLHTMDDFAVAGGEYVTPISTTFKGYRVFECPPNGQGIIALIMLNILSRMNFDDADPLSLERLHAEIEAARLAYQDRNVFVADPAESEVPVDWMLSEAHAAELRSFIERDKAIGELSPVSLPEHDDTVYLCVVDKDRNAVSFINSLFSAFGSGLVSPRTGVLLQNRGCGFVLDPTHPNCISPRKRPLHTIIPGMLVKDGKTVMPFGVMGGHYQAVGHAHLLTNIIDFGMDLQAAIDLPRVFPTPSGIVEAESGIPQDVKRGLAAMGHQIQPSAKPVGGAQAIRMDWEQGVLTGGSDPRKDGCAIGY